MRKVAIERLKAGMKLIKPVFDARGRILLNSGIEIKPSYIKGLEQSGIYEVFVEDDISQGIEMDDCICEETRRKAVNTLKDVMHTSVVKNTFEIDKIGEIVDAIIKELQEKRDVLFNLMDIRTYDNYTFEHSVNVCIMSILTARGLKYDANRLKELGIGAILHDIGKIRIPREILNKPSGLNNYEFEEMKKHTIYGFELLRSNSDISRLSAYIALTHHERIDGSGYPLCIKGSDIHQYSKIVSVADVYDALTSSRAYKKKQPPHEAIEYIISLSSYYYDKEVVESFIRNIAVYPVGTGVVFNTGEKGIVVKANKHMSTRPVVRVIYDADNKKLKNFYEVDLMKKLNVFIVDSYEL